jgi:signal transduction histidine kinase
MADATRIGRARCSWLRESASGGIVTTTTRCCIVGLEQMARVARRAFARGACVGRPLLECCRRSSSAASTSTTDALGGVVTVLVVCAAPIHSAGRRDRGARRRRSAGRISPLWDAAGRSARSPIDRGCVGAGATERELRAQIRLVEAARQTARGGVSRVKDEFLATLSHEIRRR